MVKKVSKLFRLNILYIDIDHQQIKMPDDGCTRTCYIQWWFSLFGIDRQGRHCMYNWNTRSRRFGEISTKI